MRTSRYTPWVPSGAWGQWVTPLCNGFGLNMRMSPFSGVVARCLLEEADQIVDARAQHAKEFSSLLLQIGAIAPPAVPSYVRRVSAYGYKPVISDTVTLEQLTAGNDSGLWRFSRFSYDAIAENPFWRKSRAHYPFALQIQPRISGQFPGYAAYLEGRVSLAVPTVGSAYWTEEVRDQWRQDISARLGVSYRCTTKTSFDPVVGDSARPAYDHGENDLCWIIAYATASHATGV